MIAKFGKGLTIDQPSGSNSIGPANGPHSPYDQPTTNQPTMDRDT